MNFIILFTELERVWIIYNGCWLYLQYGMLQQKTMKEAAKKVSG